MIDLNDIWLKAIRNKVDEVLFPLMAEIKAGGGTFIITEDLRFLSEDIPDELLELIIETLNKKISIVKWEL